MNTKIETSYRNIDVRKERIRDIWKIPNLEKKKFLTFLDDLSLGKVNKGKRISTKRQVKYCDMMKIPLEFWNKNLDNLTLKDVENFEKALHSGKIKTKRAGEEFADTTKADIKKGIKIYFRWRVGIDKSIRLTGWLDTKQVIKTPDFMKEEEIALLYRSCRNARERYLIAVLFDSGARAEEFLNIRFEDVFMPKDNINFVKIALKEEYSKTKGRTISLYWKHSLEAIKDYLKERKEEGISSADPIFTGKYDQMRMFLNRLGERVLKKVITPHLFRHSSATYYASRLNRQQLCIRYGWTFSSNMPDVYISRAGMDDKDLDDKMAGTEVEKIKDDFFKKEQEFKIKQEELEEKFEELRKLVILRAIKEGKEKRIVLPSVM